MGLQVNDDADLIGPLKGITQLTTGTTTAITLGMDTKTVLGLASKTSIGSNGDTRFALAGDNYFGGHTVTHLAPLKSQLNAPQYGTSLQAKVSNAIESGGRALGGALEKVFQKLEFNSVQDHGINISDDGVYRFQHAYNSRNRYIYQVTAGLGDAIGPMTYQAQRFDSNTQLMLLSALTLTNTFLSIGLTQNLAKISPTALTTLKVIGIAATAFGLLYPMLKVKDLQSRFMTDSWKSLKNPQAAFQMTEEGGIFLVGNPHGHLKPSTQGSSGITMNQKLLLEAGSSELGQKNGQTENKEYTKYENKSKAATIELSQENIDIAAKNIAIGFPSEPREYSDAVMLNAKKFVFLTTSSSNTAASEKATNGFYVDTNTSSEGITVKNSTASVVMKEGNVNIATTTGQKIQMTKSGITLENNSVKFEMTDTLVEIKIGANSMKLQAGTGFFGGNTFKWIS